MTCEYCDGTDEIDDLRSEVEELQEDVGRLEQENGELYNRLENQDASNDCRVDILVPLMESLGAQHTDILLAIGAHEPVSALLKLLGK